jgi:hypothetical protein
MTTQSALSTTSVCGRTPISSYPASAGEPQALLRSADLLARLLVGRTQAQADEIHRVGDLELNSATRLAVDDLPQTQFVVAVPMRPRTLCPEKPMILEFFVSQRLFK